MRAQQNECWLRYAMFSVNLLNVHMRIYCVENVLLSYLAAQKRKSISRSYWAFLFQFNVSNTYLCNVHFSGIFLLNIWLARAFLNIVSLYCSSCFILVTRALVFFSHARLCIFLVYRYIYKRELAFHRTQTDFLISIIGWTV